ncbi:MAG TPA: bifunctional phosphoribosyl-AMP cyclohydrolase/phosphoribosyl-ATP diphosphatase HisIE [bacterium]|nr:bifunctional phosphoribosyl-AMP cyclohydrolase/phosphoribosyl-ATP diphosphatase HisIE [bacterium]
MREADAVTFDAAGLVMAVAQDAATGAVLMVAHMNREALERTLATGQAWYWSRSRRRLWRKGEESGHTQRVRAVRMDCDGDALVLAVDQVGPACHTGHATCFYRSLVLEDGRVRAVEAPPGAASAERAGPAAAPAPSDRAAAGASGPEILGELAAVLVDRRREPRAGSYTSGLFAEGLARLNEKVMEEAAEVTRAARKETPSRLVEETADLWFHILVLLVYQGVDPARVFGELAKRRR